MYEKQTSDPVILFASPPCFEELCAVTVHILNSGESEMISQPHVIRCRELIFTESDIIASPSMDFDQCFCVIMQNKLYKTGRLQARFDKKGLKASNPYRVLPALYQACLRYTLTAKIAPLWNKVGEWLLQGRDFLTHNGYMNGIKMNLMVNSKEVYMSVFGTTVKCAHLQVHDLDIDTMSLTRMYEGDRRFEILELDQWCYILPSMKKGRIVSVSRQIPQHDCPFRTYRDLKRHWKNTYGYRLPETDDDLLYYQVTFLPLGGRLFTYPSVCLCSRNLQTMSRVDSKPIITSFLQDVQSKIQSICGQPFKFQTKIRYPQQDFHNSSIQEKSTEKSNLVSKNPKPPTVPLRILSQVQHMYKSQPVSTPRDFIQVVSKHHSTPDQNDKIFISQSKPAETISNVSFKSTSYAATDEQNPDNSCNQKDLSRNLNDTNLNSRQTNVSQDQDKSTRIIPLFRPKSKTVARHVYKPEVPKQVPAFIAKPKPSVTAPIKKTFSLESTVPEVSVSVPSQSKTIPIFSSHKSKPSFTSKTTKSHSTPKICPSFTHKNKPVPSPKVSQKPKIATPHVKKNLPNFGTKTPKLTSATLKHSDSSNSLKTQKKVDVSQKLNSNLNTPKLLKPLSSCSSNVPGTPKNLIPFGSNPKSLATPKPHIPIHSVTSKLPDFSIGDTFDTSFDVFNNVPAKSPVVPSTPIATNNLQQSFSTPKPVSNVNDSWMLKTPDGKAKKRKETGTPSVQGDTEAKKPRPKPKVQDVNVEQLARSNQLSKTNALTLTTWLKERNIQVKAKDKKGDLVDKVFTFLNLARPAELLKSTPNTPILSSTTPNTPLHPELENSCSSLPQTSPKSTPVTQTKFSSLQIPEP